MKNIDLVGMYKENESVQMANVLFVKLLVVRFTF
jgi:hypothetical protein